MDMIMLVIVRSVMKIADDNSRSENWRWQPLALFYR